MSLLTGVTIRFDTHDDDKDDTSHVHVFVKNRLNNSLTPEQATDFNSNWLALQRYADLGAIGDGDRNPYLAYKLFQGHGDTYEEGLSQSITLDLVSQTIDVNDVILPVVDIHMLADRGDRWIFDYTVTLIFENGEFSFTSAVDGVPGIVLDQDNRNHSGFGVENPLRTLPIPVATTAETDAILERVILEFSTHNDDKNDDTVLKVHIVNRLPGGSVQDIATGLDLRHGQRFPDTGLPADQYRQVEWSSDPGADGVLASDSIRLADMVLPVVYIVMAQPGDDQWIFDYQVTFEFKDPAESRLKRRRFYSSRTNGVILDQTNNKHSGVYQGRPFPTVTPPTAPQLTLQPVDHTGENRKKISIPFLRRKFDEFVKDRNGTDASHNPPLQKIRLGSYIEGNLWPPAWPLPESYVDTQAITAVKVRDHLEVRYVSNPRTIGQMKNSWGLADTFLGDIESEAVRLTVNGESATPIILTVDFKRGRMAGDYALQPDHSGSHSDHTRKVLDLDRPHP